MTCSARLALPRYSRPLRKELPLNRLWQLASSFNSRPVPPAGGDAQRRGGTPHCAYRFPSPQLTAPVSSLFSARRPQKLFSGESRWSLFRPAEAWQGGQAAGSPDRPKEQQPEADLDRSGTMHLAGGLKSVLERNCVSQRVQSAAPVFQYSTVFQCWKILRNWKVALGSRSRSAPQVPRRLPRN
jgi:hypothetical protein